MVNETQQVTLTISDDGTVRITGLPAIDRALIQAGTERTAIEHCRKMYALDRPTARLFARAVRNGQEVPDDD